ncbi:HTH-type transcriptional activator mta [bioreactor metagenome]|uniref:HTH-type transcriptional activator mta n=1 Tax=bioreactor metagenome TaxID=1076179 RepID=A0A645G894_9ZZZZ
MPLEEIKTVLTSNGYNALTVLQGHLTALRIKKAQIESLIANVEKTVAAQKGEITMNDQEKFEGFKQKMIQENEAKYGKEIRRKYGDEQVNASNARVMSWTQAQYDHAQALSDELNVCLKTALESNPAGELAQKACALHKEWLCLYWNHYSKEAHLALAQTYIDDPRFKAYYDAIAPGCAQFLYDALKIYCL